MIRAAVAVLVLTAVAASLAHGQAPRDSRGPSNGKIAFVSDRDLNLMIYVVNPDGTRERRLTWAGDNMHPEWSPNGRRIAFATVRHPIPRARIHVMNADGTGQRELTAQDDFWPSWSPDGRRIAFATLRHAADSPPSARQNSEIYVTSRDGSGQLRLTFHEARDTSPAWSSRGKIAFVSRRDGNDEIYVMNADGRSLRRLTTYGGTDWAPAWSPDGRRIAFVRNGDIYVMDADGSRVRNLTRTRRARESGPAWSPDGRKIAFARARNPAREGGDIWVMNADATSQRRLTDTPVPGNFEPNWGRRPARNRRDERQTSG